jgi:kinetochore protein Spc24
MHQFCSTELRDLLAVATRSALRPSNVPSIQQHEQELANLEADQITKGKSKNEIEAKIGAKEMELAGLKDELRNVEDWNIEQDVTGLKPESHGAA